MIDDPNALTRKIARDEARRVAPGFPLKLEVVSRETDGRLVLKDQFGTTTSPMPQVNPAHVPAAGSLVWALPMGGKFLVLSP